MKTEEYAHKWTSEAKSPQSLFEIIQSFFSEIENLCRTNGVTELKDLVPILKSIDVKFKSFADFFPDEINPDGLRMLICNRKPFIRGIHHLIWPTKELPYLPGAYPLQIEATGPNGEKVVLETTADGIRTMVRDTIYQNVIASQKIEGEPIGKYDPPLICLIPDCLLTT